MEWGQKGNLRQFHAGSLEVIVMALALTLDEVTLQNFEK